MSKPDNLRLRFFEQASGQRHITDDERYWRRHNRSGEYARCRAARTGADSWHLRSVCAQPSGSRRRIRSPCRIPAGSLCRSRIRLQHRYKAMYVEARHEALQRQSLGNIKTISMSEYRPPFLDEVGQWNKFVAMTGGTLVEKCCHYFDLINLFAGSQPQREWRSSS